MTKTDGTGDKPKANSDKTQSNDAKTNHINQQYEAALNPKKSDTPSSRHKIGGNPTPLNMEKHRQFIRQQTLDRRERRLSNQHLTHKQTRPIRKKNDKTVNNNSETLDDEDMLNHFTEKNYHKELQITTDFNNQSNNQDDNNDNESSDTMPHYKGKEFEDIVADNKPQKTAFLGKNSKDYLIFLKEFLSDFDNLHEAEMVIQKAMVQDTITQMFDQFLMGMNHLPKETKQHQTFGQGAHLCQKILLSLKHDDMPQAQMLIKRLIPKGYKKDI